MTYEEFLEYFKMVSMAYIEPENRMLRTAKRIILGKNNIASLNLEVTETGPCIIEVQQLDKLFCQADYTYSPIRIFLIRRSQDAPQNY
jgi:hypothetical protein